MPTCTGAAFNLRRYSELATGTRNLIRTFVHVITFAQIQPKFGACIAWMVEALETRFVLLHIAASFVKQSKTCSNPFCLSHNTTCASRKGFNKHHHPTRSCTNLVSSKPLPHTHQQLLLLFLVPKNDTNTCSIFMPLLLDRWWLLDQGKEFLFNCYLLLCNLTLSRCNLILSTCSKKGCLIATWFCLSITWFALFAARLCLIEPCSLQLQKNACWIASWLCLIAATCS